MKKVHGITCTCCENKSPEAREILAEIQAILNLGATDVPTPKETILKKLDEVQALFTKNVRKVDYYAQEPKGYFPYRAIPRDERFTGKVDTKGSIAALKKVVERVYSLPDGDLDFELLKVDNPQKKVGKFKVTELSDHPGVDVSKMISFNGIDLNKFNTLKISPVSRTVEASFDMKFGPITLPLGFRVGGGEIGWGAVNSITTNEEALERLGDITYKKVLTESGPESLDELKKLVREQFTGASTYIAKRQLLSSKDKQSFFSIAETLKVNVQKDVSVREEAAKMIRDVERVKEIEKEAAVCRDGGDPNLIIQPGVTKTRDLRKALGPEDRPVPKPPFKEEEIQKVHDENCKNWKAPGRFIVNNPAKVEGPTSGVVDVKITIGCDGTVVGTQVKRVLEIADKTKNKELRALAKSNAKNATFNPICPAGNQSGMITITFEEAPELTGVGDASELDLSPNDADALANSGFGNNKAKDLASFLKKDNEDTELPIPDVNLDTGESKEKIGAFLEKAQEYADAMGNCGKQKNDCIDRWYSLLEHTYLHRITNRYFDLLRDNLESFYGDLQSILQQRDSALRQLATTAVSDETLANDADRFQATVNQTVEELGIGDTIPFDGFASTYSNPSLTTSQINALKTQIQNGKQDFEQFVDNLESEGGSQELPQIRQVLATTLNPLSNLVGYPTIISQPYVQLPLSQDLTNWIVMVRGNILPRCQELWNESIATSSASVGIPVSGVTSPLVPYLTPLTLPYYDGDALVQDRTGAFETGVWNYYYSYQRIDYFFTYQEQGYNQPKPQYDANGNLIGSKIQKTVRNGLEEDVVIEVPSAAEGLEIDDAVAKVFLENLEPNTRLRVEEKLLQIENSSAYSTYVNTTLNQAARKEAAKVFFEEIQNRSYFDGPRNLFAVNSINDFRRKAFVCETYLNKLLAEMELQIELAAGFQACVEENQKKLEDEAKKLQPDAEEESPNLEAQCKQLLGSDPVGQKAPSGKCPNYTKNCYWKEYTKILQKVSLLPVIELDPLNLTQRLFRYYPVAIQIPIPPPIPPLPTLASGIPDIAISIPLPLVWKHIITVTTPLGVIVVWIALAGPIPSPYIMFIDEKGEATYMVTLKGPCSIPHSSVAGVNPLEEKKLLDILLPPGTIKVNLGSPLGKLMTGSTRNDVDNPDSGKNIIDKLKESIKSSMDQLVIPDPPSLASLSPEAAARKKKIKEAFELIPPDAAAIENAIKEVFSLVEGAIDNIKIPTIKFPKDDKKLMFQTLGPMETIDQFGKMLETALSAPAELKNAVLQDIGAAIKVLDVKKTIKEQVTQSVNTPEIKQFFVDIDAKISELEARLSLDASFSIGDEEKIRERIKIVKEIVKKPLQDAADKITPEMLGFVAKALNIPPLPFPCYTNIALPAVPPYIYILIAAIKAAPAIIDAIPEDSIAGLVSFELDLTKTLPRAEQLFYNSVNGLLDAIPDLKIPSGLNDNMFKQTLDMVKQIPMKFKVRLPKPGLPVQISIPPSLIKSLIKEAAKIAIDAMVSLIMGKVTEAIQQNNVAKIIGIALMIKALFGVSLEEIKGSDVKSFINGMLESSVYPVLDTISDIIDIINSLKGDFLSIIELFQFPPKLSLASSDGPFYDVGELLVKPILEPLIQAVLPALFNNLPAIVVLLACSFSVSRLAFTKLHPTKPFERIPAWEHLSIKNIPFLIWLDMMVATAQRKGGLGSTYLVSNVGYQVIP